MRHLRRSLAARRDALISALAQELPAWQLYQRPHGGLCLWMQLPDRTDERDLVRRAAAAGVLILPGAAWFPAEPTAPYVRLLYAAANEQRLREAVKRLAGIASAALSRPKSVNLRA